MAKKNKEIEEIEEIEIEVVGKPVSTNSFTYVGGGEDSPRIINFMGLQKFVRGQLTEVTDKQVLAKLKNHPCFVAYEVEETSIYEADEEAKILADRQRKQDAKINAAFQKKHMTE